jgi:hypothetical protein
VAASQNEQKQKAAQLRQANGLPEFSLRAQLALAGVWGTLNGAARTTFVTAPLRRHWVQTLIALFEPVGVVTRTCCRFGLNFRRLMPVIFVPTPPKYFFLPRVVT